MKPITDPVDRPTLDPVLPLEVGQVVLLVLGFTGDGFGLDLESGMRRHQGLDDAEILLDVRDDVEVGAGDEGPFEAEDERLGEDPALAVPLLPPGVGEIDVGGVEARRRDVLRQEEEGVAGEGP